MTCQADENAKGEAVSQQAALQADAVRIDELVFRVDRNKLFDTVHELKGDYSAIAERLFCVFLDGEASWREQFGLGFYGIEFVEGKQVQSRIEEPSGDDEADAK